MSILRLIALGFFLCLQAAFAAPQEIVNDTVWLDTSGQEIIAQGGSMIKVGKVYYWYGYDIKKNDVRLYTSSDLVNWAYQGIVYHGNSWYGRPDVLYNARTGRYVMITEGPRSTGRNCVVFFTSNKAAGPFVRQSVTDMVFGNTMGDHSVFKDANGDAYLLAVTDPTSTNYNGGMKIVKLTPDYLGLESVVAEWNNGGDHREAPAIFKKDGFYYLFTSWTDGWHSTATKYQKSATLSGMATAPKILLATNPSSSNSFNTQNDFIMPVTGTQGTTYIYCGDRYSQQTGEGVGKNGWYPLTFDAAGTPTLNGVQKWRIDTETGLWDIKSVEAGKTYRIMNQNSGKALTVAASSAPDGTGVEQRTYSGLLTQKWTFFPMGNNQFLVLNSDTGKALDVTGSAATNGALLQVNAMSAMTSQTWSVIPMGGAFRITNYNSSKSANVSGSSTSDGAKIEQWTYSDWPSQKWIIEFPPATTFFTESNTYKIVNRGSGKALTVTGGNTADGTLIEQRTYAGTDNQKWIFQPYGTDQYLIRSAQSGKFLDVTNASTENGAGIEIRPLSGGDSQTWLATKLSSGYYQLTCLKSGKSLNVSGSSTSDGAKIEQWTFGNWNSQQWTITAL